MNFAQAGALHAVLHQRPELRGPLRASRGQDQLGEGLGPGRLAEPSDSGLRKRVKRGSARQAFVGAGAGFLLGTGLRFGGVFGTSWWWFVLSSMIAATLCRAPGSTVLVGPDSSLDGFPL